GYYTTDSLAKLLRCSTVSPRALIAELSSAGFAASLTHFDAQGFKTNAPHTVVLETYRELATKA
ncbi:TPA: tRNA (guanine(10)-N(2))-dimethyltransferase, partial [Candidatus Micrarchaeota archaeon]|nr:tRNA (guanine(10)-N(2))-dimethyltransferase [Candidatus Micrarchaeota archaeon]